MRTSRVLFGASLLAAMALVAPGGASAAAPTTVSGHFSGPIQYEGCTTPASGDATGDWSVVLHGTSAKGTFDILIDRTPHVSYVLPGMKQAPGSTAESFLVTGNTLAGQLRVRVNGDTMSYTIEPYHYGDLTCDRVTFPGNVS